MSAILFKLPIHATPGARRTEAAGAHGAALRVRLAAPPVDGKANAALIDWAARAFGVPKASVQLLHGAAGKKPWASPWQTKKPCKPRRCWWRPG